MGLTVQVAATVSEQAQGLMGLEEMPDGIDGMLFDFGEATSATFHMQNTLIPLDIWWFNSSGVLVGWTEMEPCQADPCTRYRSPGLVAWALETPRDLYDFRPGDRLTNVESG